MTQLLLSADAASGLGADTSIRTPDGAPTRFLDRPGGRIAYDDIGAGPLVVMVPGLGDLRAEYRFLAPRVAAAGYRVVTMDLRGHGESSTGWADYSTSAIGGDIVALVAHLDAGPAAVVGTSMGAGAAVVAAATAPAQVSALRRSSVRSSATSRCRCRRGCLRRRPQPRLRRPLGSGRLGRLLRLALSVAEAQRFQRLHGPPRRQPARARPHCRAPGHAPRVQGRRRAAARRGQRAGAGGDGDKRPGLSRSRGGSPARRRPPPGRSRPGRRRRPLSRTSKCHDIATPRIIDFLDRHKARH